MLSIIAVIGKNRELGKENHLLWNLPGDLKRFRTITSGHPVIMGRKTFQSIGRVLPNRANFVITRDASFSAAGVTVVGSLDEAIEKAGRVPGHGEIFVIGGGQIYAQAIDKVDRLYLTVVNAEALGADTYFPDYSRFSKVIEQTPREENGIRYSFLTLEPA
ncbi:dihydrofolate reductase [Candidatus Gottesmanbacteria bacterium]|nr:dihydrofolate reductase [Candidatus Gottesmanbacteria bacterium]